MPPTTLNSEEPVISNEVGRDTDALCPFDQLLEHIHDDVLPWVTLLYLEYKRVVLSSNASRVGHPMCSGLCCWECLLSVRAARARHVPRRSEPLSCRELSVLWLLRWRPAGQPCWLMFRLVNRRVVTSMMALLPHQLAVCQCRCPSC